MEHTNPAWLTQAMIDKSYPGLLDYFRLEASAPWQLYHPCVFIPAFLQTETYMTSVYKMYPANVTGNRYTEEEFLHRNLSRQWSVLEKDNPPLLQYVLHQNALINTIASKAVMREQYRHLLKLSDLPNIQIQILPIDIPLQWVSILGITVSLFRFDDPVIPDTISIEHATADHHITDNRFEVTSITSELLKIRALALSEEESRRHIQGLLG